jgi:hypothetical protein
MKRIVAIVSLCLLSTACYGQQEEYRSKKWHFSFSVPEGWDAVTDELSIEDHSKDMEIRFDNLEILALLQKESPQGKNSIIVQAELIGEAEKVYVVLENVLKNQLMSSSYKEISRSYLDDAKQKWIEQGIIDNRQKSLRQMYYDSDKNVFYETAAILRADSQGAICQGTARVLGFNRVISLTFNLNGRDCDELFKFIKDVAESVKFDKNYGFGEQPVKSIFKTLWFWLFPGFGTLIVLFLLYKWIASEYG